MVTEKSIVLLLKLYVIVKLLAENILREQEGKCPNVWVCTLGSELEVNVPLCFLILLSYTKNQQAELSPASQSTVFTLNL